MRYRPRRKQFKSHHKSFKRKGYRGKTIRGYGSSRGGIRL